MLIVCVLLTAACAAPSAAAGDGLATFNICPKDPAEYNVVELFVDGELGRWTGPDPGATPWRMENRCPFSIEVNSDGDSSGTDAATWRYPSQHSDATIVEAGFTFAGSDGSDGGAVQGVRVCGEAECGPLVKPSSANVLVPETHTLTVENGEIPPGATHLEIGAACAHAAGCSQHREMEITDLWYTVVDATPPTVHLVSDGPQISGPQLAVGVDNWNREIPREVSFAAHDGESGVSMVEVVFNGRWTNWIEGRCVSYESAIMTSACEADMLGHHLITYTYGLMYAGLKRGRNQLSLIARDAAGNASAPETHVFNLDIDPPEIRDLDVTTDGTNGWQTSPIYDLQWTNYESVNTLQAPVDLAIVTVSPLDGQNAGSVTYRFDPEPGELEIDSVSHMVLSAPGRWEITVKTYDAAGNPSAAQAVRVGYDPVYPDAPEIDPIPLIGDSQLERGVDVRWSPPANSAQMSSGLCGYAVSVTEFATTDPGLMFNVASNGDSWRLPRLLPNGVNYFHIRAVGCSGNSGTIRHHAFVVDTTPPELVVSRPIAGIWYDRANPLCFSVVGQDGEDVRLVTTVDGTESKWVGAAENCVELTQGEHAIVVEAEDSAGNDTRREFAAGFDDRAPSVSFAPADAADPALITATMEDPESGLADARLEIRGTRARDWRVIGYIGKAESDRRIAKLSAYVPDEVLEPGAYELRVVTADAVGNRFAGGKFLNGLPPIVELPLRERSALESGFSIEPVASRCARRNRNSTKCPRSGTGALPLSSRKTVAYGTVAKLNGVLADERGSVLAGETVDLYEQVLGQRRQWITHTTVDAAGRFTFSVRPGSSRDLIARFRGSSRHLPVEWRSTLLVNSKVTLRTSRHRIRRGHAVRLAGRVFAAGATFPRTGKSVEFEYRFRGNWLPLRVAATAGTDGLFSLRLPLGASGPGPVKYLIRARVPWQEGWIYEEGRSKPVRVIVR